MPKATKLVTERYVALLRAMLAGYEERTGSEHGFQQWASERLGIHQAQVSAMLSGAKGAGATSASRASDRLRIPVGFFFDEQFDPEPILAAHRGNSAPPDPRIELDDDPIVYDELLAKFIRDFANEFPPEVIATMRTGVFGADGQRPSSLMGYVKLAQQLEKAMAGEVRIVFEPVKK
jgi:hypothetical protein